MNEIKELFNVAKETVNTAKSIASTAGNVVKSIIPKGSRRSNSNMVAQVRPVRKVRPNSRKGNSLQRSQWITKNPMKKVAEKQVIEGTDLLQSIAAPESKLAAGDVLYTLAINPNTLPISRLSKIAKLYTKFKFTTFQVTYSPAADMTKAGQLIGYFNYNVKLYSEEVDGIQNLQKAASFSTEKPTKVHEPKTWTLTNDSPTPLYTDIKQVGSTLDTTSSDPKWNCQGRFYLLAATDVAATTPMGVLYCRWVCEFSMPQVDFEALDAGSMFYADSGESPSNSQPMGVPSTMQVFDISNFTPDIEDSNPNRWIMQPGTYMVTWYSEYTASDAKSNAATVDITIADADYYDQSSWVIDSTYASMVYAIITATKRWYFILAITGGTITQGKLAITCVPDPPSSSIMKYYYARGKCVPKHVLSRKYRNISTPKLVSPFVHEEMKKLPKTTVKIIEDEHFVKPTVTLNKRTSLTQK